MPSPKSSIKIGVYVCHCGINIAAKVNIDKVVKFAEKLPGVAVSRAYKFMCSDPGQELIKEDIQTLGINRVVVASCSPLMHEKTFRHAVQEGELNPFYFQMTNIREHVSWVTEDPKAATEKAKALIAGAVHRVVGHEALELKKVPVHPDVLVVGGGIAGIQAALVMAEAGKKVYLVEREPSIGGHMAKFDKTFPTLDCAACILTPKMAQVGSHPNINLLTYAEVEEVDGYVGNFTVKVRKKARFVDEDLCTGCSECEKICPITLPNAFEEGLGVRKAIFRPFPQATPNVYTISRAGMPPCQSQCPLHQNPQGYVTLIREGKYREALEVILRDNPLPSICGRICTHPCVEGCTRKSVDDPINVPALKRFVADHVGDWSFPKPSETKKEKVAVVGSGPAGLMCAYELRRLGYQVDIFEATNEPGGMLVRGIPPFRLPREVVKRDIQRILDMGIHLYTNNKIDSRKFELLQKEYQAIFFGIGAYKERTLGIDGEDLPGVWQGLTFLEKVIHEPISLKGKKVVVIGGGNSALDAARTAYRCGASQVTIAYRRTIHEMPADPDEIQEAKEEGITFQFLLSPTKIEGKGKVEGVTFQKMELGEPDESGRRRTVPILMESHHIPCHEVIVTIGQVPDLKPIEAIKELGKTSWGTLKVDEFTLETSLPGVFAGGDCVSGPDVVVNAMFAGKKAANSIHRYLNHLDMRKGREMEGPFRSEVTVDTEGHLMKRQIPVPKIPSEKRRSFEEVVLTYTEEQARMEASRCMECGQCCDCRLCSTVCEPNAINYEMQDEILEIPVGSIILATGFKTFDATRIPEYGFGYHPNVYTSLQIERMVNASGPTGGEIQLANGEKPKKVGIIHCVGSRHDKYHTYCSKVCCMYSLKLAHLVKERTGADVYNFYIDMRTPGKGYEEFYEKLQKERVHFIRGRVAEVTDWPVIPEEEGYLVIRVEDTLLGTVRRIPVDMVVLSVGLEAQHDAEEVRRLFNISCSHEGWFLEQHPKLAPVSTFTSGIFLAGTCQGPKDIPETVAQAGAAASEALSLIDRQNVFLEPDTAWIEETLCSGCKTCIPMCPYSAISYDEEKKKSVVNEALCKGCGTCVSACPSGAAQQHLFQDDLILEELKGVLCYA